MQWGYRSEEEDSGATERVLGVGYRRLADMDESTEHGPKESGEGARAHLPISHACSIASQLGTRVGLPRGARKLAHAAFHYAPSYVPCVYGACAREHAHYATVVLRGGVYM